jgi:SAM-dependent methyltransferase
VSRTSRIAPNRHAVHPFDLKYGTDTGGYLSPDELRCGTAKDAASDALNNGYSAVAPSVFREAIRRWRDSLPSHVARLKAYSFVDVGAGKGRALLLASGLPFRKVIGVELNQELARIARRNSLAWNHSKKAHAAIRVLGQDATQFRWPRAPLLVFLNNPFECELIAKLVGSLADVARAGPGLVDILYVNPGCAETIARHENFPLLWNAQIQMDEEDQRADPYGAASDRVAAFRFRA